MALEAESLEWAALDCPLAESISFTRRSINHSLCQTGKFMHSEYVKPI